MSAHSDREGAMQPAMPSRPGVTTPAGLCDTHVHVFDPARHAYAAARRYTPPAATCEQLGQALGQLGAERVVVVQPSCYGDDNAAMLDALHQLGCRARGVAVLAAAALQGDSSTLATLHRAGVRGVRLNASVNDLGDRHALTASLHALRDATAHLGWHVQLYLPVRTVVSMADGLTDLSMPVVLDHFAGLDATSLDLKSTEVSTLLHLLNTGHVHIKLSAPYRVVSTTSSTADADFCALGAIVQRCADVAPDRLLWGTDWPHTGGAGRRTGAVNEIEPFRNENAALALEQLFRWLPDADVRHRILVSNPERLYGFAETLLASPPIEV